MLSWILSAMNLVAQITIGGLAWLLVFTIICAILTLVVLGLDHMGVIDL